jgi:hypothetical protein
LYAPQNVTAIAADVDGNLLASSVTYIFRWNYLENRWTPAFGLPGDDEAPHLQAHNDILYAVGAGQLWRLEGNEWVAVSLPDSDGAYLTAILSQYPQTLWVLDSARARLWSSEDGQQWEFMPIAGR